MPSPVTDFTPPCEFWHRGYKVSIGSLDYKVEDITGRLVRNGARSLGVEHSHFARRQKAWIDRMLWEQKYIFRFEAAP